MGEIVDDFDWNHARAFLATAQTGSFSAAARRLSSTQPTVGRQVAALERELGVTLIERVPRGVRLTATGLELVEQLRAMDDAANRVSRIAAGQTLSLEGTVRVSASEVISVHLLPSAITRVRMRYPGIELEVIASNQASDLRRREADIALRNFRPRDPELIARRLPDEAGTLYATPAYLERIGSPTSLDALSSATFIGFDRDDAMQAGLNAMGLSLTAASFQLRSQSQLVQWELVKQGLGIGVMMTCVGDPEPAVRRALDAFPLIGVPMWLTSHQEVRTSRRVRAVFDALAEHLTAASSDRGSS